jgi:predicted porin
MKKSLFAIAAVTAFAGAAQAQSSVTVYGIMDVGFAGTTSRTTTAASAPNAVTAGNQVQSRTNTTGFSGAGSETTSRLGVRGREDIGGGTAAFFTAEFALNPTQQNLSGDANGGLFNRQAFVGLSQKGIGQAAIGTQYTPIHLAVGATDPGQQNNMIGSIIYTTSSAQGNAQTSTSYTVRQNQSITAQTENIAGFVLSAMYVNNNRDATQYGSGKGLTAGGAYNTELGFGGTTNSSGYGLGANYTLKKLYVTAAYQSFKNETDNANATSAYPAATAFGSALPSDPSRIVAGASTSGNGVGTVTSNGFNITDNQFYGAAVYDFGILKAYANYINRKATSTNNSNAYVSRTGQQIGVRSFITPKVEVWASGGTGRYSAYGAGSPTANFTAYQVGSNYLLSKRTNLYGIYGATQVSSTGTPAGTSAGASSYGVGVRHTF